jgi:hypothetical protein
LPTYPAGAPCWVDLGTPDPAAAAAFYRQLFGWQVDAPDAQGYRLCRLGERLVGALGPGTDPGTPYWTTNVSVRDLAATVVAMRGAGGKLVAGPGSAGALGRFAACLDAEGGPVSLWQPGSFSGAELTGVAGTWAGTELVSARPDAALEFYREVFGWRPTGTAGAAWTLAGQPVATVRPRPDGWPSERSSLWTVHFAVADLAHALATVADLGGGAPLALPGSDAVLLTDNQGALFGLRPSRATQSGDPQGTRKGTAPAKPVPPLSDVLRRGAWT